MSTIDEAVEVRVPVGTAYDQWTQFESFPRFMEGVQEVHQLDDTHVRWKASVGGVTREWTAEITEQVPDTCIAWRAVEGHPNIGEVRFEKRGADTTLVHLHMEHEPESTTEAVGDWLGMAKRRARQDLERFRDLIEQRGVQEGAWRGEVHGGDVTDGDVSGRLPGVALAASDGQDGDIGDGSLDDERPHRDVTEGPTPETRRAIRETDDDFDDEAGGSYGAAI